MHTGQYITRVGDSGDTLFFLASGSCSCVLNGVELERLRKGQCFGEVALLNMCKVGHTVMLSALSALRVTQGQHAYPGNERCSSSRGHPERVSHSLQMLISLFHSKVTSVRNLVFLWDCKRYPRHSPTRDRGFCPFIFDAFTNRSGPWEYRWKKLAIGAAGTQMWLLWSAASC